jgi:hypothetical protein
MRKPLDKWHWHIKTTSNRQNILIGILLVEGKKKSVMVEIWVFTFHHKRSEIEQAPAKNGPTTG